MVSLIGKQEWKYCSKCEDKDVCDDELKCSQINKLDEIDTLKYRIGRMEAVHNNLWITLLQKKVITVDDSMRNPDEDTEENRQRQKIKKILESEKTDMKGNKGE